MYLVYGYAKHVDAVNHSFFFLLSHVLVFRDCDAILKIFREGMTPFNFILLNVRASISFIFLFVICLDSHSLSSPAEKFLEARAGKINKNKDGGGIK